MQSRVAGVVVGDPIIVAAASTIAYVRATRSIVERDEVFRCEVMTRDDTAVTHFSATLECTKPVSRTTAMNVSAVDTPLPVHASDVYALFFHGPTFRVLQRAGLVHDAVVAEVATHLPDLTSDPTTPVCSLPDSSKPACRPPDCSKSRRGRG